jgi:hypothetical protein
LSFNPHALVIYLEFVPTRGVAPESFKECQCEDDDVCFHYQIWILSDIDISRIQTHIKDSNHYYYSTSNYTSLSTSLQHKKVNAPWKVY